MDTTCVLAATGFDAAPILISIALLAIGVGTAWLFFTRGKRRAATFALIPLLLMALVMTTASAPTASFAAGPCPAGSTPSPAPAPGPTTTPVDYQPGAAGIGDSYYPLDGNGGYDVQDYALDLAFDPTTDLLSGTATITATATQNLSTFNLDFDVVAKDGSEAIDISAITVNGAAADWSLATTPVSVDTAQPDPALDPADGATPPRTELTVIPAAGLDVGTTITTTVAYSGIPITVDDAFGPAGVFQTDDGMVVVGEPRVAATWFPSNDHPADKATMTLRMTVADDLKVIGNGRLVGTTPVGPGASTWEWRMDQPIAPYLATATVGDYAMTTTEVDGITYVNAIAGSLVGTAAGDEAATQFAKEPEVLDYLSTLFGPYPFTESGGIAVDVPNLYFALENQTRPIYPGAPDESTLVHELAHQWYGDDVSLSRWSDIWLNEGFATYAEWMWSEHTGGATAQQKFDQQYSRSSTSSFWAHAVADPGPAGIFDSYTYNRGAMALHALRLEVGDTAFFAILQGWASGNAGGNGTTEEFIAYAEQVSGQDLGDFFTAWLYTPSKPALS
ncbi:M1 family metallopeptidase [Cnuibacter sp. UC19_7]|uniref:M1 family metallopeptidase n=1 Tax=Cnuibacter sp. UC19_7 TaxID=3350166 RepID=UPI0036728E8F